MTQSFWANLRAMGVLAAGQGKPIQVTSIKWNDPGPSSSYIIFDGVGTAPNNQLRSDDTSINFAEGSPQSIFHPPLHWRDWQVAVITGGEIEIDYV